MATKSRDKLVTAVAQLIRSSQQEGLRYDKTFLCDAGAGFYRVALGESEQLQVETKEDLAAEIVNDAFHELFKDIFVMDCDISRFSQDVLKWFEMISEMARAAISCGLKNASVDEYAQLMHKTIKQQHAARAIRTREESAFLPVENLNEFKIILDRLLERLNCLLLAVMNVSQTPEWFSEIVAIGVACLIPFKFPWLPPSKSVLFNVMKNALDNENIANHFSEMVSSFFTKKVYHKLMIFPQLSSMMEIELFPGTNWFKCITVPEITRPVILPETFKDFITDTTSSINSTSITTCRKDFCRLSEEG
jgi:hypothetical protein